MSAICSKCGVPHQSANCPRWAIASLRPDARVCIRIGNAWPDLRGHVFAYFADCADDQSILVYDLTSNEQFESPRWTAGNERRWTVRPSREQEMQALDDLALLFGKRYRAVKAVR